MLFTTESKFALIRIFSYVSLRNESIESTIFALRFSNNHFTFLVKIVALVVITIFTVGLTSAIKSHILK